MLRDRGIRDGRWVSRDPPGWTRAASHAPNGNFDEAVWRLLRGSAGRLRKVTQRITERRDHLSSRTITQASTLRDARGAERTMSRRADDAYTEYSRFQGLHALCGLMPVATLEADGLEPRLVQTCHTCGAREGQTLTRVELERLVGSGETTKPLGRRYERPKRTFRGIDTGNPRSRGWLDTRSQALVHSAAAMTHGDPDPGASGSKSA